MGFVLVSPHGVTFADSLADSPGFLRRAARRRWSSDLLAGQQEQEGPTGRAAASAADVSGCSQAARERIGNTFVTPNRLRTDPALRVSHDGAAELTGYQALDPHWEQSANVSFWKRPKTATGKQIKNMIQKNNQPLELIFV